MACILVKGVDTFILPQYSEADTTTIRVSYKIRNEMTKFVVTSAYTASEVQMPVCHLPGLKNYQTLQRSPLAAYTVIQIRTIQLRNATKLTIEDKNSTSSY